MESRRNKILSGIGELRRRRSSPLQVQGCQWKHVVGLYFTVEWIRGVNSTLCHDLLRLEVCVLLFSFNDYNVLCRATTCI